MPALTDKTDSEKWQIFAAESTRTYMWQMGSRNRKTENISERSFSQISCERKRNKKRMAKKKQKKNTVLYLAWAEALKWACHCQTLNFVRCMKILHNFIFIARNVESVGIGPGTNNRILWKQIYAQNEHS